MFIYFVLDLLAVRYVVNINKKIFEQYEMFALFLPVLYVATRYRTVDTSL